MNKKLRLVACYLVLILGIMNPVKSYHHQVFADTRGHVAEVDDEEQLKKPVLSVKEKTISSITIKWKSVKQARWYEIYRSNKKNGSYKKIAKTKKKVYKDKKLNGGTTYYYKIVAATSVHEMTIYSKKSKAIKVTTKVEPVEVPRASYVSRKTAYVGDSLMYGLQSYNMVSGKNRKVIAQVGITAGSYWESSITDELLDYEPTRVYIMLGMNSLVGTPSESQMNTTVKDIEKIVIACQYQTEGTQVIILPVPPTGPGATVSNSSINQFNLKLRNMAKKNKIRFFDYTAEFKDSDGGMKSEYGAGDGIHWKQAAYKVFKSKLDAYEKTL